MTGIPYRLEFGCMHCHRPREQHLDGRVAVRRANGFFDVRTFYGLCPVGGLTVFEIPPQLRVDRTGGTSLETMSQQLYEKIRLRPGRIARALEDTRRRVRALRLARHDAVCDRLIERKTA